MAQRLNKRWNLKFKKTLQIKSLIVKIEFIDKCEKYLRMEQKVEYIKK